jgi:hypothetical protein
MISSITNAKEDIYFQNIKINLRKDENKKLIDDKKIAIFSVINKH